MPSRGAPCTCARRIFWNSGTTARPLPSTGATAKRPITPPLRLQRACYSDVSGKTRRGQAAVALLVARLGQQLPSPAAPARPSQPFYYQWQFARNNSDSDDIGCMLIVFAFPLLAVCAWLAVFLNSALQRANVPGSMLITTAVTLLGLCGIMLGLNNLWLRHDSRPAPTLLLDRDGVHYQNGRKTLRIPWANISLVETRQNAQEDGSWRCAVYLYWQAHAKAAALCHYSIDTSRPTEPQGDCRDLRGKSRNSSAPTAPTLAKRATESPLFAISITAKISYLYRLVIQPP